MSSTLGDMRMGPEGAVACDPFESALCRKPGVEPETFFPFGRLDSECRMKAVELAAAICRRCPAADACLAGAHERGERFGVWAGIDFEAGRREINARTVRERRRRALTLAG